MTLTLEIDPQSGHIVRSTSKTSGTEFSTDYSDFRIVDGLLFALREENTAGGTKTGTNEISKVEVTRVK